MLDTATALGLQLCFTPVRSPESNGIAEALAKTFKRDYARLSILPDAATVIALLRRGSRITLKFTHTQA
jgi:putative transposase